MVRMGIQLRVPAQDFSMLSLPPPHEWDVRWLRRLASLDCEQYRHALHHHALPRCMRAAAAGQRRGAVREVIRCCPTAAAGKQPPTREHSLCGEPRSSSLARICCAEPCCLTLETDTLCAVSCPPQLLENGRAMHSFMALNSPAVIFGNAMRNMETGESGGPCTGW